MLRRQDVTDAALIFSARSFGCSRRTEPSALLNRRGEVRSLELFVASRAREPYISAAVSIWLKASGLNLRFGSIVR
jgi:hypothetical protein